MSCSINACYDRVQRFFGRHFEKYGKLVGTYPLVFICVAVVVVAGLSVGMIRLESEKDTELLYTPINSRAFQERAKLRELFLDGSGDFYLSYSLIEGDIFARVIFRSKGKNILTNDSMSEIKTIVAKIEAVIEQDNNINYSVVCARFDGNCVVSGNHFLDSSFLEDLSKKNITYPIWNSPNYGTIDLSESLGEVEEVSGILKTAKLMSITFHLRQDTAMTEDASFLWEGAFLKTMQNINSTKTEFTYSASQSLDTELDANTGGDIVFFSITFTMMITYATITAGGDCVSSRMWLAWAGVLAAGFGIIASMGLISACGVKFVNIVGVMPFLVIGIGVDDMFLLMSGWAETHQDEGKNIPERVGKTFRLVGVGITITSLTDILGFVIGASSVFLSVRNFCIYTGVAILFTYLFQISFFAGCMALQGRRVDRSLHCITCRKTTSRDKLRSDGKSPCAVYCCGGAAPTRREDDESICEKMPRLFLPKIVLNTIGKIVTIFLFMAYLGVSIWGVTNLKQGLVFSNLVSPSSYFHKYSTWVDEYFPNKFPVSFVIEDPIDYTDPQNVENIKKLLDDAIGDRDINQHQKVCWLLEFMKSPSFNNSSPSAFISELQHSFLLSNPRFKNDIVIEGQSIKASRCYVFSNDVRQSTAQADVMVRMRKLADESPLPVLAYFSAFIYFEQYISILPSTLQTVGIALAVMFVVTWIFMPHPLMVAIVVVNIVMILVGIFGFMYFWDLSLSSVTMIHLIMSVGFSVDFSVHVCTAYIVSEGETRGERTEAAIVHAAGPILNGAISSFIGIIILAASQSYIFQSFFKIMFTVILFGMIHAVLLIPVILSLIGPLNTQAVSDESPPAAVAGGDTGIFTNSLANNTNTGSPGSIELSVTGR